MSPNLSSVMAVLESERFAGKEMEHFCSPKGHRLV